MEKLRILELFSGIGACSKALENLGLDIEIVDAVEIDKYAMKSFNAIHGTNFEIQDITKMNKDFKNIDIITHGSPCQDFSVAGKQAGGDIGSGTRSSLMYETIRIVGKIRPKYVLWENVKNLLSKKHKHNFDAYIETMNILGYNSYYQILDAKDYGVPQHRERVYTVSIRKDIDNGNFNFPEKEELKIRLKDVLEDEVDEKYYLSDKKVNKILYSDFNQEKKRIQNELVSDTLLARDYKDPKCVRVCGIFDTENSKHQAGSIYDKDGLSPTLDNMQGGYRQPSIIEDNRNLKEKLCDSLIEKNIVQGGEIINHSYTNSKERNTLDKFIEDKDGIFPTMTTRPDVLGYVEKIKVIGNYNPSNYESSKVVDSNGLIPTVKENHGIVTATNINNLRIRKLTPKECWRLMSFDDEDFEKASQVNSNSQLYKQARKQYCSKSFRKNI